MRKLISKIGVALTAMLVAFGLIVATSVSASATAGNTVYNMGRDGDVAVQYYNGSWFNPLYNHYVSNSQCVKPRVYMVSQWGGGYAAGVTRCFTTSNNTLKLYRFGEGPA